jgi:hypothetical protein
MPNVKVISTCADVFQTPSPTSMPTLVPSLAPTATPITVVAKLSFSVDYATAFNQSQVLVELGLADTDAASIKAEFTVRVSFEVDPMPTKTESQQAFSSVMGIAPDEIDITYEIALPRRLASTVQERLPVILTAEVVTDQNDLADQASGAVSSAALVQSAFNALGNFTSTLVKAPTISVQVEIAVEADPGAADSWLFPAKVLDSAAMRDLSKSLGAVGFISSDVQMQPPTPLPASGPSKSSFTTSPSKSPTVVPIPVSPTPVPAPYAPTRVPTNASKNATSSVPPPPPPSELAISSNISSPDVNGTQITESKPVPAEANTLAIIIVAIIVAVAMVFSISTCRAYCSRPVKFM